MKKVEAAIENGQLHTLKIVAVEELQSRSKWVRLQESGKSRSIYSAGWSSLVARRAHNPEVGGSNTTPATMGALRLNLEAPFFLPVADRVLTLPFLVYCRSLVPSFI